MKLETWAVILTLAATGSCSPTTATAVMVEKRMNKVKDFRVTSTTTQTTLPAWRRTIYGTIPELVYPTVIAGVTFSAKPPTTTDPMAFWVSLNRDGAPKTIKPKNKGGIIENLSPGYSTWFDTPVTTTFGFEELKAHNMKPDEKHVEVNHVPEDRTYVLLNPIIRCTPERYFGKQSKKVKNSEPFCTPHQNQHWRTDKTYFLTWYSKFFKDDVKKVRIHMAYISESLLDKGMAKRGLEGEPKGPKGVVDSGKAEVSDRTATGTGGAFFSSAWVKNDGIIPIFVEEKWLTNTYSASKVVIAIQPDTMPDNEFDFHSNSVKINLSKTTKVGKGKKGELKEEGIASENVYYVIAALPTVVVIAALGMYVFLWLTRADRDVSHLRKRHGRFGKLGRNQKYDRLPQFEDIPLKKMGGNKQH